MSSDRIEKKVVLRAARDRVWRAIGDSRAFGAWFGVSFEGPFVAGTVVRGKIVPTKVDAEVAKHQEPYTGVPCNVAVERIEPERHLSFRWHPGGAPNVDETNEPTTLVEFDLEDAPEGTLLTITESGFDRIPLDRRAKVFAGNERGWEMQTILIGKYLDGAQ
jgi:uncharacterized protein YndB with AHSA1/START domain